MTRIMVTGACGQIGTELVPALRAIHGAAEVLATDVRSPKGEAASGPFELLDCRDPEAVGAVVDRFAPKVIYHLAALLSATSERRPQEAYQTNLGGLVNVLEAAREARSAVFHPSSIAVFGPGAPSDPTPQEAVQRPASIYGITKTAGELLCDYYHRRYHVDTRGLRFPGLISYAAPPGGGSTDYAVEIFPAAVREGRYTCFLRPDTQTDMLYMPDAVRAALELMAADPEALRHRNAYNITSVQITPARLAEAIRRRVPELTVSYAIDPVRQAIADSWPRRVDDSEARRQWGWRPEYDLEAIVEDMLTHAEEMR